MLLRTGFKYAKPRRGVSLPKRITRATFLDRRQDSRGENEGLGTALARSMESGIRTIRVMGQVRGKLLKVKRAYCFCTLIAGRSCECRSYSIHSRGKLT